MQFQLDRDCSINNQCELKHQESVELSGILTIKSCPPKNEKHILKIGPRMLDEKLLVEIETYCQCDCEKKGEGAEKSDKCNSAGTHQCGICYCDSNRYFFQLTQYSQNYITINNTCMYEYVARHFIDC